MLDIYMLLSYIHTYHHHLGYHLKFGSTKWLQYRLVLAMTNVHIVIIRHSLVKTAPEHVSLRAGIHSSVAPVGGSAALSRWALR